jgi:hypothetical protein
VLDTVLALPPQRVALVTLNSETRSFELRTETPGK